MRLFTVHPWVISNALCRGSLPHLILIDFPFLSKSPLILRPRQSDPFLSIASLTNRGSRSSFAPYQPPLFHFSRWHEWYVCSNFQVPVPITPLSCLGLYCFDIPLHWYHSSAGVLTSVRGLDRVGFLVMTVSAAHHVLCRPGQAPPDLPNSRPPVPPEPAGWDRGFLSQVFFVS